MRTAPLRRQLCGLVDALAEETVDKSKIANHTVYVVVDRLEPLDENAGHCRAELCARFSIVAHSSDRGVRGAPAHGLPPRYNPACSPVLRKSSKSAAWLSLGGFDRCCLLEAENCCSWHKHFKFELVVGLCPMGPQPHKGRLPGFSVLTSQPAQLSGMRRKFKFKLEWAATESVLEERFRKSGAPSG
jgi:hypothetical protein